jgi:nucleolar GTP-binding protein
LDYAFRNAKKRIDILKQRKPKKQDNETYARYQKYLEIERVKEATAFLEEKLSTIHKKFPQFDDLPEFYQQLARLTIKIDEAKKALAAIKWAVFQCKAVRNNTVPAIKQARTKTELQQTTKQFYGRVSSIIKQIRTSFTTL